MNMSEEVPPPPPKKSNWWVWVLVGCGGLLLIGGIVCGGCMWWGWRLAQSMVKVQQDVEATLRNDPRVREEFGDIREVLMLQQHGQRGEKDRIPMKFQITGSKRSGMATALLSFEGGHFDLISLSVTRADGTELKLK